MDSNSQISKCIECDNHDSGVCGLYCMVYGYQFDDKKEECDAFQPL